MPPDIFIFAGEASGDLHGAALLKALYKLNPNLRIVGVGGPKMREEKMENLMCMEEFQVMGFVDVFLALPNLIRRFKSIEQTLLKLQPKVVITIDYPGFNLRLLKALRKRGFKNRWCHYVSPSVWAWGKKRIFLMEKHLDLLLSILPFEKAIYAPTTLPVEYVGNPLVQKIPYAAIKSKKILAIFPGSRRKEIERNLPIYMPVIQSLQASNLGVEFALSVANKSYLPLIKKITQPFKVDSLRFVLADKTEDLMRSAYCAIAKSGTVTLELALHQVPTVVTYAMTALDIFLATSIFKINLPYYSLPNIIANRLVFPELIGPNLSSIKLLELINGLSNDPVKYRDCIAKCKEVRALLGTTVASDKSAELILSLLNR